MASVVQSLSLEKKEKKRQYFTKIANQNYLPTDNGTEPTKEAIANHVSKTFNAWAERFEMPEGDSNILLSMMESLNNVVTTDANMLEEAPIRNATKEMLGAFFGTCGGANADEPHRRGVSGDTGSITDAFEDEIDHDGLLKYSDPTIAQNDQQHQQSCKGNSYQPQMNQKESMGEGYNASSTGHSHRPNYNFEGDMSTSVVQEHGYSNNIDFTPIQPSYQPTGQYQTHISSNEYCESNSSVFPESFPRQNSFAHSANRGDPHQMTSNGYHPEYSSNPNSNYSNGSYYGNATPMHGGDGIQRFSPHSAPRGSYHSYYDDGMQGHQYQGHGGYSLYNQHQQFM
eukprot:scaffold559_cov190-Alexandrium_tamarense.AAC.64